ncbi:MarR family EPS-associated transcriptional regulator [Aliiruegeria sabulilitoris]|uniref:MarR family EPS-associated transcriptional regulator n=1 Tax=Aliiruegeria sabulilitoris TaxID=1510458 RepID=UPI0009E7A6FB|nr:MarR family EPS-associated transcriptional regulator [Aliiruegeria sabulilitoris]NDR56617.1 MarR family EPS-associated transcriptional regulator [Pseudoruegeria sp. M32A2M]
MPFRQTDAQEDARFRILHLLQSNPEMSQRDLAAAAGISIGKVHYVLNAFVEKGLVKIGNFTAANDKRRYTYILTRKGLSEKAALTGQFFRRKLTEYEALKAEIEVLRLEMDKLGDSSLVELKDAAGRDHGSDRPESLSENDFLQPDTSERNSR